MQSFYGGFAVKRDYSAEGGCEEESASAASACGTVSSPSSLELPNTQQRASPQRQPTGGSQSFFNSFSKAQGVAEGNFQFISYDEFDDFVGDVAIGDAPAPSPLVSRAPVSNGTSLHVASSLGAQQSSTGISGFSAVSNGVSSQVASSIEAQHNSSAISGFTPVSNGVSLQVSSSREAQQNSTGTAIFAAQQQSQPRSRNLDFRTVSFADWLAHVDDSGTLSKYLEAIEENYDTVAQILKTYSASVPGEPPVDPQFFEDIEVTNSEHKALFCAWFAEANGLDSASTSSTLEVRATPAGGPDVSMRQLDAGLPPSMVGGRPSREELRVLPFRTWLLQVDAGGSVLRYQGTLEANYDTVAQVAKTYALPAKGGRVLDVQFFEDSGIVSEQHQQAFARWFARECDLSMPGEMSNGFAR